MEDLKNNSFNAIDKAHVRSVSYPSYTISESLEFVQKLYLALGSSGFNTRESVAKVLNYSSGTVQMPLSTATQYGLIEMKSKVGYRPTPLFISIYKPRNEAEKRDGYITALNSPKLYQTLLSKYSNEIVPSKVGLGIQLFRDHAVGENVSEKAASIFIENLHFLNLIDSENILRLNGIVANDVKEDVQSTELATESIPTVEATEEPQKPRIIPNVNNAIDTAIEAADSIPIIIPFKSSGRRAKLVVPENVTNEELDKIIRFIDALRE